MIIPGLKVEAYLGAAGPPFLAYLFLLLKVPAKAVLVSESRPVASGSSFLEAASAAGFFI